MPKAMSVAEVKAKFSACLRDAERGEAVLIHRHGTVIAALVRAEDFDQLERLRRAGPKGGLASVAGGWKGSDELVELIAATATRGGPRPVRGPDGDR